jgi:hypothetical protein
MMTKKEEAMPVAAMPVIDAVIIAAICRCFCRLRSGLGMGRNSNQAFTPIRAAKQRTAKAERRANGHSGDVSQSFERGVSQLLFSKPAASFN